MSENQGLLSLDQLQRLTSENEIDTVLVVFTESFEVFRAGSEISHGVYSGYRPRLMKEKLIEESWLAETTSMGIRVAP